MNQLLVLLLTAAIAVPPPPAPPRAAALPAPIERTLDNGLRVITVEKSDVPLVAARLMVRTGAEEDTRDFAGLARLTASLLTQGTQTRSAEQIARGVEALGATLRADADWDYSAVDVDVMSTNFPKAMDYFADVVRNAVFKKEEIERVRTQSIDALTVSLQEPMTLARLVAARVIFQERPYGQAAGGTPQSLARIQREQIAGFHERNYRPDHAVLLIAGDIKPEQAFALAEKAFGTWKTERRVEGSPLPTVPQTVPAPRIVVVDMPDAGQAAVVVTRRGIPRADPLLYQALVTNSILGGGYSARLNQEIRIKRGLSYGATSFFEMRREAGPFVASTQTKNESAAEVAGILIDELDRLATADLSDKEMAPRKAVLIGNFGRALETNAGIVDRLSMLALHKLPLDEIGRYVPSVQAVSATRVREFAAASLAGNTASVVIVGDAKQFLEALRKRFPQVEVVAVAELNIDSATLRK